MKISRVINGFLLALIVSVLIPANAICQDKVEQLKAINRDISVWENRRATIAVLGIIGSVLIGVSPFTIPTNEFGGISQEPGDYVLPGVLLGSGLVLGVGGLGSLFYCNHKLSRLKAEKERVSVEFFFLPGAEGSLNPGLMARMAF